MHVFRLDRRLAEALSTPLLAFFVLLPSVASTAMVITGASFFAGLPAALTSAEDKATISSLAVSTGYFLLALIANIGIIVAAFRAANSQNQP